MKHADKLPGAHNSLHALAWFKENLKKEATILKPTNTSGSARILVQKGKWVGPLLTLNVL
jgi:hypothetical protein